MPEALRYRTPLGDVDLDRDAIESLATSDAIERSDRPFRPEHSLETEIPFLQQTLEDGWQLVPVLIGAASTSETRSRVAESLRPWVDAQSLIVVSSDFTHYGARFGYVPFNTDVPKRIRALDMGALDTVLARDAAAFRAYVDRTGATICGHGAIDVLLQLLPAETSGRLVAYDTSGRMTGDWKHTVSYASVAWDAPETET